MTIASSRDLEIWDAMCAHEARDLERAEQRDSWIRAAALSVVAVGMAGICFGVLPWLGLLIVIG